MPCRGVTTKAGFVLRHNRGKLAAKFGSNLLDRGKALFDQFAQRAAFLAAHFGQLSQRFAIQGHGGCLNVVHILLCSFEDAWPAQNFERIGGRSARHQRSDVLQGSLQVGDQVTVEIEPATILAGTAKVQIGLDFAALEAIAQLFPEQGFQVTEVFRQAEL